MAIAEQDMHPAVRLLLARMETDPDEFIKTSRWEKVLDTCRTFCSEEERNAISEKYRLIQMDAVHVEAMKVITHANDPEPEYDVVQDKMYAVHPHDAQQLAMQQMKADQVMQQMGLQHDKAWQDQMNGLLGQANQAYGLAQSARPRLMPPYAQVQAQDQRPSRTGRIFGNLGLGKTNK
jgi:hypothetical protein